VEKKNRQVLWTIPALIIGVAVFCAPVLTPSTPAKEPGSASGRHSGRHDPVLSLSGDDAVGGDAIPLHVNLSPLSPPFKSGAIIRIALSRAAKKTVFFTRDSVFLRQASAGPPIGLSGLIAVVMHSNGRVHLRCGSAPAFRVMLPCTLSTEDETTGIVFKGHRYRGSMVLDGTRDIMVRNCLEMEDYLRGVVPLEMGKRSWQEIEALKAQAVASRTYACKHVLFRQKEPFDMLGTIADQVYGGADAETPEADSAVGSTQGLVILWGDSLADIYFHSTCGGRTAAFDEAWDKPPCPYLQSESDLDPDGKPYCAFSPLFEWDETWSAEEISSIIRRNSGRDNPGEYFSGRLRRIRVLDRFPSGRINSCRLEGKKGYFESRSDHLRFVLRRTSGSGGLLRSSNFTIVENGPRRFTLHGKGYGHGVGMCQMGAVGRARSGQSYDQILRAYFSGTEISTIN